MRRSSSIAALSARTLTPPFLPLSSLPRRRRAPPRCAADYDAFVDELERGKQGPGEDADSLASTPGRVASIVGAAEAAAQELRAQAESRARERIAEADRAAENRVRAAEEEAREILAGARAEAEAA